MSALAAPKTHDLWTLRRAVAYRLTSVAGADESRPALQLTILSRVLAATISRRTSTRGSSVIGRPISSRTRARLYVSLCIHPHGHVHLHTRLRINTLRRELNGARRLVVVHRRDNVINAVAWLCAFTRCIRVRILATHRRTLLRGVQLFNH